MSVDYSSEVFYGVELDISVEDFYKLYDGDWDHSGPVKIEQVGDHMTGPPIFVAYLSSSRIEMGRESDFFGVVNLNSVTAAQEGYEIAEVLNKFGIKAKSVLGWKAANNVS